MKALGLLALMLPVAVAATTAQVQFRSTTSLVRLEVSVTDDAGSVRGLRASDFVVEDRGRRQAVRVEEFDDTALDLVLVAPPLSTVTFIAEDQTSLVAAGVTAFLDQVQARDRLGVVLAGAPPRRLRPLEPGRPAFGLEAFIGGDRDYSASFDAIALGLRVFDTAERRRAIVAFTSAADFRSIIDADAVAELAARFGPPLVLVGTPVAIHQTVSASAEVRNGQISRPLGDPVEGRVTGRVVPAAFERFAERSGGVPINLGDADPATLMAKMFAWLRTQYVLSYRLPEGQGWHPVTVRVNRRGVKVVVREGYVVG